MKNKNVPIILLVIGLIIALLAAIYASGASPAYNGVVDTIFSDIAGLFKGSGKEAAPVEKAAEVPARKETAAKKKSQKEGYELTNGGYSLASMGKNRWVYDSEWPFVTAPVVYNDTVVSVTSEPAFITLSVQKGALVSKQECPVYPGEAAVFQGTVFLLTGRDGKEYKFAAEEDGTFTDLRSVGVDSEQNGLFLSQLAPDAKSTDFILKRIREWASDSERKMPEMQVYTGHINQEGNGNYWAEKNADADTVFYVFTPDEQGMYQMGLADEKGSWITANAFIAVFGENGDLKQVSLDYVANKPVVKLHLSDTELYYIVAGWAKDMYDGTETWLQIAESR